MTLESFISKNHSKSIWRDEEFRYDNIIIFIRVYEPFIIEAAICYPSPYFRYSDRFDLRKLNTKDGELAALYVWIRDIFFPGVRNAMIKRLSLI